MSATTCTTVGDPTTMTTVDEEVVHVESLVCPSDGPLVRIEVETPEEGWRSAYLTPAQARALAASLHVYAYRATSAARGED